MYVIVKCQDKFSKGGRSPKFSKTPKLWTLGHFKSHLKLRKDLFENLYKDCKIIMIDFDTKDNPTKLEEYSYYEFIQKFLEN